MKGACNKQRKWIRHSALLLILLPCLSFSNEQDVLIIERSWDFGVGIGFGELSNPFIGADDVPANLNFDVAIYGEKFFFDNGNLGYTLIDQPSHGLHLIANYSSDRIFHSFFSDLTFAGLDLLAPISALPDRNFTLNVGLESVLAGEWGQLQASLTQDALGQHKGQEVNVHYTYGWQLDRWGFAASVGGIWKSGNLVDYYYGLLPEEVLAPGLAYFGRSTVNTTATFAASYRLSRKLSLVGKYTYERLGSGITDSPLIVEDRTRTTFLGLFYRF